MPLAQMQIRMPDRNTGDGPRTGPIRGVPCIASRSKWAALDETLRERHREAPAAFEGHSLSTKPESRGTIWEPPLAGSRKVLRSALRAFLVYCVCVLGAVAPAFALDPGLKLSQYHHTSWAGKDGAPTEVSGIAEAPDGYLWLATPEGLMRFDGVTFERVNSLGGDDTFGNETVLRLCADNSGGVWMTLGQSHGAALYKDGKLVRFKGRTVVRCVEAEGAVWLVSNGRLARYFDGQVREAGSDWGLPSISARFVAVDKQGTVFTYDSKTNSMWYLPQGRKRFLNYKPTNDVSPLVNVVAPDGSVWGASSDGFSEVGMERGTPSNARWLSQKNMSQMLFDRDGGFWATDLNGLIHVGKPSQIRSAPDDSWRADDYMTVEKGLSANVIWQIYEDRQGNIWLGTSAGLERFRDSAFAPVKLPGRSLPFSVASAGDGTVWAANFNSEVLRVDRHASIQSMRLDPKGDANQNITGFYRDSDGSILAIAQYRALWRLSPAGSSPLLKVPLDMSTLGIISVARDKKGALWIASARSAPVSRYYDGKWTQPAVPGLPPRWNAFWLLSDHRGRIWSDNLEDVTSVILIENETAVSLGKITHGLNVGNVQVLYEREGSAHIWVGGVTGVALFDGSRFHTLQISGDATPRNLTGILETSNGDLWLHGRTDGFRIDASEMKKFYADPTTKVSARHFDGLDGLTGSAVPDQGSPTVVEDSNGLVWFSSTSGLAAFDPARRLPEPGFPAPHVRSISAGDRSWPASSGTMELAPLSRSIAVSYTATSLGTPERVRFRYRLDGVDQAWRDAGNTRVARYDDVAPGRYRFRVMSTNENGSWSDSEASLDFHVPPAWFQTWAFRVFVSLLAAFLIWLAYRTRVAQLTRRVRLQLKTQQSERDRIARDLHDTLLQGVQGLIWRLHTIAGRLPQQDPVRLGMESALDSAESILAHSRDRVQDLRGVIARPENLVDQLTEIGENLAIDHAASFSAKFTGTPRDVDDFAQNEVCFIAREALSNAFSHSGATEVGIHVAFADRDLTIEISDNGVGIEPDVLMAGKAHHFGLTGMRERADGLGGTFTVASSETDGTTINLVLRASIAYKDPGRNR